MIFVVLAVLALVGGAAWYAYRNRPENSIESGILSFRREMRALAPPPEDDGPVLRPPPGDGRDPGPGTGD